jgi:hypothetical protein
MECEVEACDSLLQCAGVVVAAARDIVTREGTAMTRRVLLVITMLNFGMVLPVSPAAADPIKITGGSAVLGEFADATVDIVGQQGFHAQFNSGLFNTTGPWQCGLFCPPGTILSPFGFIESIDGAGTAQFRGVLYQLGSTFANIPGTAVVSIRPSGATLIVPPFAGRPVTLTTPFDLPSTTASFFEFFSPREDDVVDLPLSGKGTFTMTLIPQPNGEPFWQLARIRYDFAPTPEPATLVLVTTGLGTLALRRRRRSQSDHQEQ